ncbi:hypothetical protein K2173_007385 [Erythroxylum novogranatense]|uniref:Uncharacterized protein n=1 Tax=Erythroxylum novogranatense TaxID=1862640 RepID=A0AAV8T7A1_9ROSI|nr:hypothetical protein K2173_007385 [Erythroxylum novogranatense]
MAHLFSSTDQGPYFEGEVPDTNSNQGSQDTANHAYYSHNSAYIASPETVEDQAWYADSGATNHITSQLGNLTITSPYSGNDFLFVGNGAKLVITHIGSGHKGNTTQRSS